MASTQSGVVTESRVYEGQQVAAGEVLFVLSNQRTSATKGDAEQVISTLLQGRRDSLTTEQQILRLQTQQRMGVLQRKATDLAAEVRRVDEQLLMQQRRTALAEQAVQRYQKLEQAGFISPAGAQDKQAELLDQQGRLSELQRTRAAALREQDAAQADLNDLALQAKREQAAVQREEATLEQDLTENEARRELLVRAPQAGIVSAIIAEPGQTVMASQVLASLSPLGSPLEAELYAPSRAAGFVKPGMTVLLRYQAYPYQKFGQFQGYVREVSSSALRAGELNLSENGLLASGGSEPLYRVRVRLDKQQITTYGKAQALKTGMVLEASVLLEQRKLYEWVLEPLYSISGKM
ncbi:HlyD family secretion protein [Neisseriaceae bacterium TC5R-5]|nr:HlyD family secretion protein [Neisseriaceae bacterium TC5R-5]